MTAESPAVDTSVAVPLMVATHQDAYGVLTRLPGDARVSPADAVLLLENNFAEPLILSAVGARDAHREFASKGIAGGATYDGVVALTAREHNAVLLTRDARARSTYEALGVSVEILARVEWDYYRGSASDRRGWWLGLVC